ncbi:MAG TPA: class I SAM-dependent methyltransferase [Clostridia bacterium]
MDNIDIYNIPGTYTKGWFLGNREQWWDELRSYRDKPVKFLEVGCYQGQATVWNLKNILSHEKATMTVIDSFEGGSDQEAFADDINGGKLLDTFKSNIAPWANKVIIKQGMTYDVLPTLRKRWYDWIYIDAGHGADEVYSDAVLSWPLLKKGGLLFFDDYTWLWSYMGIDKPETENPKYGIDKFLLEHQGEYEETYRLHQLHIKKLV